MMGREAPVPPREPMEPTPPSQAPQGSGMAAQPRHAGTALPGAERMGVKAPEPQKARPGTTQMGQQIKQTWGTRAQTAGQKTARAKFTEMKSRFADVRKRNMAVANALMQVSMLDENAVN